MQDAEALGGARERDVQLGRSTRAIGKDAFRLNTRCVMNSPWMNFGYRSCSVDRRMPSGLMPMLRNALPMTGLVHLAVVYVVWGSTYLAIRVAVRDDGFPPFTLGLTRVWAETHPQETFG